MTHKLMAVLLVFCVAAGVSQAEKGRIIGTVNCARSGVAVSVHPVSVMQDKDTLARTLTDRLGKFQLDFTYTVGKPLTIRTGSTPAYLEAQGAVEPDTEVAIRVMPRWATILGIVTDRATGRGMADVKVQAARGDKLLADTWAKTKTDATGVYMIKVMAFDGDDVSKPVRDLWLAVNEGDDANQAYAMVHTDSVPLWAWPDPTEPTKVEVALPDAKAAGLTIADVVSMRVPDALRALAAAPPAAAGAPAAPGMTALPGATPPKVAPPEGTGPRTVEVIVTCPCCGKKIKITITPAE